MEDHNQTPCPFMGPQYQSENEYDQEGISLKELLLVLIRGWRTIAVVAVAAVIIAMAVSIVAPHVTIGTKGEVQTAVQIYFSGIDEGKRPDGTVYDVNEIKSAEILKKALDSVSLSSTPSVTELASCISFEAVLPDEAARTLQNISELKTENLKLERLESLEINPDTYIVSLNVSNRLGISKEEGRELLDSVLREYKQWLIDKYSGQAVLSNLLANDFDLSEYDYIQIADSLSGHLDNMERYVNERLTQRDFHSLSTGLSPEEILSALDSVRTIQLEQLYTLIGSFYITKDASRIVGVYEQLAENKERLAAQSAETAASLRQALLNFEGNEQTLIMADSDTTPITIKTKSEAYDQMVSQAIAEGNAASNASVDAAYYRSEAARFSQAQATYGPGTPVAKEADQLIQDLEGRLKYWNQAINKTAEDYYNQVSYQKYVEQLIPAKDYDIGEGTNLPLNLAIGLVLGLIIGVLAVLFKVYVQADLRRNEEEVAKHV